MNLPSTSEALRFHEFGTPTEVLKLESIELPQLKPDEVRLKILAAPINPADYFSIKGQYGIRKQLPAIAGMEGLGEVVAHGSDVANLQIGDRCFIPSHPGAWQSYSTAKASDLFRSPDNMEIKVAAMCWINPATAWLMLKEFEKLQPGDWVVQNAATSAVGKLVIQFASHLGYKTVNLARSLEQKSQLEKLGADFVLKDDEEAAKAILEAMGGPKAKLALNAVGGQSAISLAQSLAEGCNLITYGAMDGRPAPFPARLLIFNDIRLRGFWVSRWYENSSRERIELMMTELFQFMSNTQTRIDIAATYPLNQYREALLHSIKPGKEGKVLFVP